MEEVALLADRVYVLADGQVVLHGPPRQVFAQGEVLASLGLEVPVVRQVVEALVQAGLLQTSDVLSLEEAAPLLEALLR
jgi:ABC-type hemin transport system ATPase subunit